MENGWIKYFSDGSKVVGLDRDVAAKKASWRKSRHTGMIGASIFCNDFEIKVVSGNEIWQSDLYESSFPGYNTICKKRYLQTLITDKDHYVRLSEDAYSFCVNVLSKASGHLIVVPQEWHNKWLVVEYDIGLKRARYFISEGKV